MSVTIRRAEPGDAETIIRLIDALGAFVKDPPTRLTPADIRRDGFGPDAWFTGFIAEDEGRAIGYAMAYTGFSSDHGGRGLHLSDLYVDGELRQQGIGRRLMAAVARHGQALGARWMVWDVWVENETAQSFYTAIGARPYHEVTEMVLRDEALDALAAERA
jgi:ribosomal protein S18 acetylase RimI-like enzyme